ncbi:CDK2-associated and cullin domain-containing protein 1-like [Mya arenaria]|uniref:CDK2-associated and cullin domain-containing protein 1-like n=1 Tax=Mya arenaria TaxID=6604 RepID=UPI0022E1D7AA|nr:CDK2-associated and cullin domain-containing protein 1-like [Mya arenaria]
MDEPMDEFCEADSTQGNEGPSTTRNNATNPLLRPGSMVMMTITVEDYETQYWPKLEQAIHQLLTMTPGQYIPISYEQMYSCVYKCVCKQFSERLYQDLIHYMAEHLTSLAQLLDSLVPCPADFLDKFSFILNQYLTALSGIVPIFNYMNRFYVETKLKTDLNDELRKLFRNRIVDTHITLVLSLLEEAHSKPFTVSPPTMSCLVKNLYSLNCDYANLKPSVFSKYIPNILPPTSVTDLDRYIEEARLMQEQIQSLPEFQDCDGSGRRKRRQDELML